RRERRSKSAGRGSRSGGARHAASTRIVPHASPAPGGLSGPGRGERSFADRLRLGLRLSLVVFGDVVVHLVRKVEVLVDVRFVRVVRIRTDREALLRLPFQDPLAARRAVILLLDLVSERARLLFREIRALRKPGDDLVPGQK